MITKGMMSSLRTDWKTPKGLLKELRKEFGKFFDPCPTNPKFDGLKIDWKDPSFVNPPYGREIGKWCEKSVKEWQKGITVVMLIPSRTDTHWFHDWIMRSDEIRFIRGRLKFDDNKNPAPFPSAIIVFKGKNRKL